MKVAFNNCYGGFDLSPEATTEYARLKGIKLYWYVQVEKDLYTRLASAPPKDSCSVYPLTKDLGIRAVDIPNKFYYSPDFEDESRADPDLIQVIEQLGDKANSRFSDLQIQEIPDVVKFEITDYDGMESVVPPRQSW